MSVSRREPLSARSAAASGRGSGPGGTEAAAAIEHPLAHRVEVAGVRSSTTWADWSTAAHRAAGRALRAARGRAPWSWHWRRRMRWRPGRSNSTRRAPPPTARWPASRASLVRCRRTRAPVCGAPSPNVDLAFDHVEIEGVRFAHRTPPYVLLANRSLWARDRRLLHQSVTR